MTNVTLNINDQRGLRIAFHFDHGGYVTHIAEVTAQSTSVQFEAVISVCDVGPII
jgi:CO/xanthine dehydrogenase Mo-binding subunit